MWMKKIKDWGSNSLPQKEIDKNRHQRKRTLRTHPLVEARLGQALQAMGHIGGASGHPQERTLRTGAAQRGACPTEPRARKPKLVPGGHQRLSETAHGLCAHHPQQSADGDRHPDSARLWLLGRALQRTADAPAHPAQGGRSVDSLRAACASWLCAELLLLLCAARRRGAGKSPHPLDTSGTTLSVRGIEEGGDFAADRIGVNLIVHHRVHGVSQSFSLHVGVIQSEAKDLGSASGTYMWMYFSNRVLNNSSDSSRCSE